MTRDKPQLRRKQREANSLEGFLRLQQALSELRARPQQVDPFRLMHSLTSRLSVPYSSLLEEHLAEERRFASRFQDPFLFDSLFSTFPSNINAMLDFDDHFTQVPAPRPQSQLSQMVRELLARAPIDIDDDDDGSPRHSDASDVSIAVSFHSSVAVSGPKRKTPSPRDEEDGDNVDEVEQKQPPLKSTKV